MKGHNGLDISCNFREPVCSAHDGYVMNVSKDRGKGIGCYVRTLKEYDYKTGTSYFKTGYWHFDEVVVEDGDYVEVGQLLGYGDTTGYSTGSHLHLEMKAIYQENGVWLNREDGNGYCGCTDPLPFITEIDAQDRRKQLDSIAERLKMIAEKVKWLFEQIKSK
jgi:murein DD-endopeptidase MepM/ murein hydrolase activator NlpD